MAVFEDFGAFRGFSRLFSGGFGTMEKPRGSCRQKFEEPLTLTRILMPLGTLSYI